MTNMFKKTLVAAALSGFAFNAAAATLTTTAVKAADEYLANVKVDANGFVDVALLADRDLALNVNFSFAMGVNYAVNDIITFEFDSAALDTSSTAFPATKSNVVTGDFAAADVVLSRLSVTQAGGKTTAIYRVSSIATTAPSSALPNPGTGETIDAEFVFSGIALKPRVGTTVTGGPIKVAFSAKTVGDIPIDNNGDEEVVVFTKAAQFVALDLHDTNFDAVIDVSKDRKKFVVNASNAEPSLNVAIEQATGFGLLRGTVDEVTYTLSGNFSWLLDEDGDLAIGVADVSLTPGCAGLEVEADKLSFVCDSVDVKEISIEIDANNDVVIPTGTFSLAADVTYDVGSVTGKVKSFTNPSVGTWSLNGSSVHIPYMPYRSDITQVINLNNAGTQTGAISVEGIARNNVTGVSTKFGPLTLAETSSAGSQAALAGAIKDALGASLTSDHRISLTIITNVPAKDVTVYSAYNVGGSGARLVVNDSNGKASNPL